MRCPLLHADGLPVAENPSVDRKRVVTHFITMGHALRKRGLHRRLAHLLQSLDGSRGIEEILIHVAAATEARIELLQHEKYFAVDPARFVFRLDIDGARAAVLSRGQIPARADVRMIKTEARWPRREFDPPHAARGNEWRALLRGAVHIGRYLLAVPVQLLGRIRLVVNVHGNRLALFEADEWPRELAIVGGERDDPFWRDLDGRRLDVQRVVRCA